MEKRIVSVILILCMVLPFVPTTVFAADDTGALQALLDKGGTVTLNKDYTISSSLKVAKTVTLDLNGYVISMTGNDSVLKVTSGKTLTLQDNSLSATGVITGGNASQGGGVYIESGSFTMNGGTIDNCRAKHFGGGIYGPFNMNGGTIKNCSAYEGGGVYTTNSATITMKDGTIKNCSAINKGGGVFVNRSKHFIMNGGTIDNCSSENSGGGVYVNSSGIFSMNGGTIDNCSSENSGGGVYVNSSGIFSMNGGTIDNCIANNGGGIHNSGGTFNMNDGTIKNCSAKNNGGGVYSTNNSTITMKGGTIEDCTSTSGQGGAVTTAEGSKILANGGNIYSSVSLGSEGTIQATSSGSYTKFYDRVTNNGTISGGVYYGDIKNEGSGKVSGTYYTVSFKSNGGSYVPTQWFVNISTATALHIKPTRDNYEFKGWYNDNTNTSYDFSKPVTSNYTLSAKWVMNSVSTEEELRQAVSKGAFRIKMVGDIKLTSSLELNDKIIKLDLNGHVLSGELSQGCYINLSATNSPLSYGAQLILNDSDPTATHTDKTLPLGGVVDCTIALNAEDDNISGSNLYADGGTVTKIVSLNYAKTFIRHTRGETTRTAFMEYVCGSLSTDSLGSIYNGIFYKDLQENLIKGNIVTFKNNDEIYAKEIVSDELVGATYKAGVAVAPIEPVKAGYIFAGWYNGNTKYDFSLPVTSNITLTAKWVDKVTTEASLRTAVDAGISPIKLLNDIQLSSILDLRDKNLTLDLNGHILTGDIILTDTSAAPDSILTLTDSNPTATHTDKTLPIGGVLKGGITLARGNGQVSHLYANGGTITGMVSMPSYVGGIFCTSNTPTAFKGYVGNYGEIHGGIFYDNINESCIKEKTVTFMNDNNRYALEVVEEGNKVVAPITPQPKNKNQTFAGWYNGNTKYDFTQTVTENIILTARWISGNISNENELKEDIALGNTSVKLIDDINLSSTLDLSGKNITIDLNGYVISGADILINTGIGNASLTLTDSNPTATHTDSTLPLGGVVTSTISMKQDGGSFHDCILYGNGGTVTSEFNTNTNAVAIKCTSNTPTAFTGKILGYAHLYGGIYYNTIESIVTIHEKKVTFKFGDKDYAYEIVASGNKVVAPITPQSKDKNQTFDGWYNGDTKYTFGSTLSDNITLTATFSEPIPNGLEYTINENKVTVTGYTGSDSTIVIPGVIKNKPVTTIGEKAFTGKSITGITIPNSVTLIEREAFMGCENLTSIVIPNSVTSVKAGAFAGCINLTDITISESVTAIENNTFYGCTGLTSITIPDGVKSIGNSVFYGCTNLESITIPNSVTSIGLSAFSECKSLTSIAIPNGVTSIESEVFVGCENLSSIVIPNSVTSIKFGAFAYCRNLTGIDIPSSVTAIEDNAFYGCTGLTDINISKGVTTIGNYAFSECSNLKNIEIPGSVSTIGENAFKNCTGLTSIPIPDGVTSIGNGAFENCTSLENITIPGSIVVIEGNIFYGCTGLTSVNISDGVKTIGNYAFSECSNLKNIEIPGSISTIGEYAFKNCTGLTSIPIPDGVTSIGNGAFAECTSLENITIPDSVTVINDNTFCDCTGITSITIPDGVTSIGNYAFIGCINLKSIEIPSSLSTIGSHAFYNCQSLENVTLPNHGVQHIGYGAFGGCSNLKSIEIPDSVSTIEEHVFDGCESLTSVTIPNGVTSIGNNAFFRCSNLKSIDIPYSVTSIGSNAFYGCSRLESIFLPNNSLSMGDKAFFDTTSQIKYSLDTEKGQATVTGLTLGKYKFSFVMPNAICGYSLTSIGREAFLDCEDLRSIVISDSVTSIKQGAFSGCRNLTDITISNSVTSIESFVFYGCENLTSIDIPNSVQSIGYSAFLGCSNLKSIEIPYSVSTIGNSAFYGCRSLERIFLPDNSLSVGDNAISYETSQVKYSLDTDKGEITITEIKLGKEKTSVNIPDMICGYPVVAVAKDSQENVGNHTCKGGTATCKDKATCDICGEPYGELDNTKHNLENIPAKNATITEEGNIEHWHCIDCGKYFSDKDGKNTIELKDTVIAILPAEDEQPVSEVTDTISNTDTDNGDIKGSKFAPLKVTATSSKKKTVTLTWSKVSGAKGYIVYGAMCGKTMKKIKTTTGKSYTVKNLKSGKYYKYMVVAYKTVEGKKVTTSISKVTHVAVKGGKFGNPTEITVNKIKPIKQGEKLTLEATVEIDKKVKNHVPIRYESTNTKIAKVNSKGVITAKAKGVCYIYVYAQNGVYKKVKVTVK